MRAETAAEGPDVVLSRALRDALTATLTRGEQALLLLNRRGFASALLCRQCGRTLECPNCSVSLTLHRAAARSRCHYCNYGVARPRKCKHCAGPYLETIGFGTERGRGGGHGELSRSVGRADRPGYRPPPRRRGGSARPLRPRRRAGPDWHPDDRQGARLSERHACRRNLGRRRADLGRLPGLRAYVPASDAGGRPCRPRRPARGGGRAVLLSRALQHRLRLPCRRTSRSSMPKSATAASFGIRRWSRWSTRWCAGAPWRERWPTRTAWRASCAGVPDSTCSAPRRRRSCACGDGIARSCS